VGRDMGQNSYNIKDEENYKHVVNLLKELPRVKADDNFEFNLNVKIQNKNFELNYPEKQVFQMWKILLPVGTFAVAAIVFFIFFTTPVENMENPFQIVPKLRTEVMGNLLNSQHYAADRKINKNDVIIKQEVTNIEKVKNSAFLAQNENNLKKDSKNSVFPFNDQNSIDLDEINGVINNLPNNDPRITLTSRNAQISPFDGFYLREEVDKKYVEALKARLDSLKNEMQKQSSR
jgi:hypothetical protein